MSLRKILASALLVGGFALLGGAAIVGFDKLPTNTAEVTEIQVILETEASKSVSIERDEAPEPIKTARVEAAWRDWMDHNGVTQSSLAIGRGGTMLHTAAQMRSPDVAYQMASLSKAVTGMCLNQLLTDGPYTWNSTIADLAPEFAKMNFTPAIEIADLTLTQIATHTSGLPEILTYGAMSTRAVNLSSQPTMAKAALKEPSNFGPRGDRVYSNANYAILGFLIEAIAGEAYSDYCKARIMTPAGATQADVVGRMANTAGYGGWSVSVEDYARFAMFWFDSAQPWMMTPTNFAYDSDGHYGMGTYVYPSQYGTFVSHFGRWTHNDPQKPNVGALFFVREDGVTVVVNWDGSLDYALYHQLHEVLRDAL